MDAKMKVIFEPEVISATEVEKRLKFIKELPIKVQSNPSIGVNRLEMEVSFGADLGTDVYPIGDIEVFYNDLNKVDKCDVHANASCVNIDNHNVGSKIENYNFFYKNKK
jgi:hypothetical protein